MKKTAYMLLPLTGFNTRSFDKPEYFVNAYLSPNKEQVVVELRKVLFHCTFWDNYMRHWYKDDHFFIEFYIPSKFAEDVVLFEKGEYRQMSNEARIAMQNSVQFIQHTERITQEEQRRLILDIKYSRHLKCHTSFNGKHHLCVAPALLAAIAPVTHPAYVYFKEKLEKKIGTPIPDGSELMTPPDMNSEIIPDRLYSKLMHEKTYVKRSKYEKQ